MNLYRALNVIIAIELHKSAFFDLLLKTFSFRGYMYRVTQSLLNRQIFFKY